MSDQGQKPIRTPETKAEINGEGERVLVLRATQGDRDAYQVLFERYHRRIFAMALELLRSREDAQDVAQDAFVKAFLSLREFKGDSSFYTWVYRIAYNLVIDLKRKVTRRGGPSVELNDDAAYEGDSVTGHIQGPHAALYRKEQQTLIDSALRTLSAEHRATIVLREVDGLSYDEIAEATGVTVGTVMSRLFYARRKLQKALQDVAPEASDSPSSSDGAGGGATSGVSLSKLRRGSQPRVEQEKQRDGASREQASRPASCDSFVGMASASARSVLNKLARLFVFRGRSEGRIGTRILGEERFFLSIASDFRELAHEVG